MHETTELSPESASVLPNHSEIDPTIRIKDLDFAYGSNQVLHGVSLDIYPREVMAFIGPSGCGKSTLLRCLNRMNDLVDDAQITKGSIEIHGNNLHDPSVDVIELRKKVGMVFQKSNHSPNPFIRMWPMVCKYRVSGPKEKWIRKWRNPCARQRCGKR